MHTHDISEVCECFRELHLSSEYLLQALMAPEPCEYVFLIQGLWPWDAGRQEHLFLLCRLDLSF